MPSRAASFPKVNLERPDCRSAPTKPRTKPTESEIKPRICDEPSSDETVEKATNIRATYSAEPTWIAQSAIVGAVKAKIKVAMVPATNEPIAAVASAGPARPLRAILLPSSAVITEPLSPGVFNKIEVVEPPYIAP